MGSDGEERLEAVYGSACRTMVAASSVVDGGLTYRVPTRRSYVTLRVMVRISTDLRVLDRTLGF